MIKYFHELRFEEIAWLIEEKTTYGEIFKDFPPPPWCSYTDAIVGFWGCWSITGNRVTGESSCVRCECYRGTK